MWFTSEDTENLVGWQVLLKNNQQASHTRLLTSPYPIFWQVNVFFVNESDFRTVDVLQID